MEVGPSQLKPSVGRANGVAMRYDAAVGPDPSEWADLDEAERIAIVRRYHRRARMPVGGSPELHAAIHVAVESQLVDEHPAAKTAYERLSREGLERHDVIHAIGSVLAGELYGIMKSKRVHDAAEYARRLGALTAEGWRRSFEE